MAGEENTGNLKQQGLIHNWISLIGLGIAAIALANIAFLFFLDIFSDSSNPYIGILAYGVIPGFLVLGLVMVPIGIMFERRRRHKLHPEIVDRYPAIDLNNPKHRAGLVSAVAGLVIFLGLSALGSYHMYEYTESVQFCGTVCHEVMHPEHQAYLNSPHARVKCAECHVGAGADWYVKSKLSGAYQIYAYAFRKFPRPIPTPVENLRPAQDTCEQCHWPSKFHGSQYKVIQHYLNDEQNTPFQVHLLIKTGGGDPDRGPTSGIHWHMNINNTITYAASDDRRQVIPYVRAQDRRGNVTEYFAKDSKLKPEEIAKLPTRKMDCVDCHNRPTHIYQPPERSIEESMASGKLNSKIPFMKVQAVAALSGDYKNTDEAMAGITKSISTFYKTRPEVPQAEIDRTITELQRLFKVSRFPEMKVDWRTHFDNIGHLYYSGCFRCHDDNHVSKEGKVITKDCKVCHEMLEPEAQKTATADAKPWPPAIQSTANVHAAPAALRSADFKHPVDLGDLRAMTCTDCHTGGP